MDKKNFYEAPQVNISYFEEPVMTDGSTPGVGTPDHWFDN